MTFLDKLKEDYPTGWLTIYGMGCPCGVNYEDATCSYAICDNLSCDACWNREMPETTAIIHKERLQKSEVELLEKYRRAFDRLGDFGKLFLDYDGCPRGPIGRAGFKSIQEEALLMKRISDVYGNVWIPVQAEVLYDLIAATRVSREEK